MKKSCLTAGARYTTRITPRQITVTVDCPSTIDLSVPDELTHLHGTLEARVHDAMEWVLGPWFYHAMSTRRCELVQKKGYSDFHLSPQETKELAALDARMNALAAFSETPSDNEAMNIIRRAAALMRKDAEGVERRAKRDPHPSWRPRRPCGGG